MGLIKVQVRGINDEWVLLLGPEGMVLYIYAVGLNFDPHFVDPILSFAYAQLEHHLLL